MESANSPLSDATALAVKPMISMLMNEKHFSARVKHALDMAPSSDDKEL
jgi:hypothetical protein